MFGKLVVIFALVAVAFAALREYPAGVHPAICPDYPNCDPLTLARFTPDGTPIPEWGFPGYQYYGAPAALPAAAHAAARYPADFNAAACPNYPYCW